MRWKVFVDILAHEANAYRKLFSNNVKDYPSRITVKGYEIVLVGHTT